MPTRHRRRVRLYARAVPGMHRAGPGERGGASYGRRDRAPAKWAAMRISGVGKGLIGGRPEEWVAVRSVAGRWTPTPVGPRRVDSDYATPSAFSNIS